MYIRLRGQIGLQTHLLIIVHGCRLAKKERYPGHFKSSILGKVVSITNMISMGFIYSVQLVTFNGMLTSMSEEEFFGVDHS